MTGKAGGMASYTGIVGYGSMGVEIANHLARSGHWVCVYDTDPAKRRMARAQRFSAVESADTLAERCDVVLILVGDETAVTSLIADDGPFTRSSSQVEFVCVLSTVDPASLGGNLRLAAEGRLVDAPVCRALEGARHATLLALFACSTAAVEALRGRFEAFCSDIAHVSERLGDAQVLKTVNNMMLWGAFMATEEAFSLAREQGIDPVPFIELFSTSSADSWALRHWKDAHELAWSKKDMAIATHLADRVNMAAPLSRLVGGLVRESNYLGHAT